jgi:hypothetical protein
VFVLGKLFLSVLMFEGKVMSLLQSGAIRPYLHILGLAGKAQQGQTLLIMNIRKLQKKKFYNIGPLCQRLKMFFLVTYEEST